MMNRPLPRLIAVEALSEYGLSVVWSDGATDIVDMAGLLETHPLLFALLDPAEFEKVSVADYGGGIEWENGADYAADALLDRAQAQRRLSYATR